MADIDLIVVPYDSGRRGERMGAGPAAFIDDGLPRTLERMGHDAGVTWIEATAVDALASAVDLANGVAACVRACRQAGRFPIVLSGNCISTLGAVAGVAGTEVGVVWLDAHGDLNTPATSPSGFLDGMAAAAMLGWCHGAAFSRLPRFAPLPASRLMVLGCRALDALEAEAMHAAGIVQVASDAARDEAVLGRQLDDFVAPTAEVYLHIDVDVLDPAENGPANSYAAPGGLTQRETIRVVELLAARRPIAGLTLSSYEPAVDPQGLIRAVALPFMLAAIQGRRA